MTADVSAVGTDDEIGDAVAVHVGRVAPKAGWRAETAGKRAAGVTAWSPAANPAVNTPAHTLSA